jgi:SUMO ligase MMS21 Smc5/6 complex component
VRLVFKKILQPTKTPNTPTENFCGQHKDSTRCDMLFKPEQLPIFNTHPVIAYFGMDTIVEVIQWYLTQEEPTLDNVAIIEKRMIDIIINDHDRFFNMVEDYLDAFKR